MKRIPLKVGDRVQTTPRYDSISKRLKEGRVIADEGRSRPFHTAFGGDGYWCYRVAWSNGQVLPHFDWEIESMDDLDAFTEAVCAYISKELA